MTTHWIGYTTRYRDGGPELKRAAETGADTLRAAGHNVRCVVVESKADFLDEMQRLVDAGSSLQELHFYGHSGLYGPMFGTTALPEQFSPHEWRSLSPQTELVHPRGLKLPLAPGARASFHACRTARWFAPFFARTFGVAAGGFHFYTTFTLREDRFVWPGLGSAEAPLFLVGCRGKKSDGLVGSVRKYAGLMPTEPMQWFEPEEIGDAASYDGVAERYDAVFEDIRVRRDEWRWLNAHLDGTGAPRVLDIGCGNGALLRALEGRIASGVGVDASEGMLAQARRRTEGSSKLNFVKVDGPQLPFADGSFDVVTSLLSFRYLDWDPLRAEVRRVLAPGGRLLIVDMVAAPVGLRETPRFGLDAARALAERARNRPFREALKRLTADPQWQEMIRYNPIRAQHEFVWFLESRFPGQKVEVLNVGWQSRVLAFDSGPLQPGQVAPQTYP
jgi:ubiquinone/menaquinone biosynthesis C-methylase UbiE